MMFVILVTSYKVQDLGKESCISDEKVEDELADGERTEAEPACGK